MKKATWVEYALILTGLAIAVSIVIITLQQ